MERDDLVAVFSTFPFLYSIFYRAEQINEETKPEEMYAYLRDISKKRDSVELLATRTSNHSYWKAYSFLSELSSMVVDVYKASYAYHHCVSGNGGLENLQSCLDVLDFYLHDIEESVYSALYCEGLCEDLDVKN